MLWVTAGPNMEEKMLGLKAIAHARSCELDIMSQPSRGRVRDSYVATQQQQTVSCYTQQ